MFSIKVKFFIFVTKRRKNFKKKSFFYREVTSDILYEGVTVECSISGGFYKNFPSVYKIPGCFKKIIYPPLSKNDPIPLLSLSSSGEGALNEILPLLRHTDEDRPLLSVLVTATADGIYVNGHKPTNETTTVTIEMNPIRNDEEQQTGLYRTLKKNSAFISPLNVVNWSISENKEALIFIHGYNISVDHAAKKLAQLIASGNSIVYI